MQESDGALGVMAGGIPVIEKADVVLPQKENKIVWYHRNEATTVPLSMKLQGLESAMNMVHDPLMNRTFGGCISGIGLVKTAAGDATQTLKTKTPYP